MDQLAIAVTGLISVWLTQDARADRRRFACWFGLAGQPFWFYATWQAQQWGRFALCFAFAAAWMRGVWVYWVVPWRVRRSRRV